MRLSIRARLRHGPHAHEGRNGYSGWCRCGYKGPWRDAKDESLSDVGLHMANDVDHPTEWRYEIASTTQRRSPPPTIRTAMELGYALEVSMPGVP